MNLKTFESLFEKYDDEFLEFDRVENPKSQSPDLNAMILLDSIVPTKKKMDMIAYAGHEEIVLRVDVRKLAKVITEVQVLELIRSGITYDEVGQELAFVI